MDCDIVHLRNRHVHRPIKASDGSVPKSATVTKKIIGIALYNHLLKAAFWKAFIGR